MVGRVGLEPTMPKPRIYSPLRYQFRSPTRILVPRSGLEPETPALMVPKVRFELTTVTN